MEKKKMMVVLFFMALTATVTAQTQVLQNPEFDLCFESTTPKPVVSWSGGRGVLSFSTFPTLFPNPPAENDCFYAFQTGLDTLTQTNVVLDTAIPYEFEMLAGCTSSSGGFCTFSLTINDVNIPLTNNVLPQPATTYTLSSITAKNFVIYSSPATVKISFSPALVGSAAIAHAFLTTSPDSDEDGVPYYLDNCPTVSNPNQADYNQNGVGDACECSPDLVSPTIECRASLTVTLSVAPFSSTVLPTTPVSFATDNCGPPSLSLDKTVFTLRDSVAPVTVKATATDGNSKTDSCITSVATRMIGSILTNSPTSLLSLPRGVQTTLTWTTNVASFSSSDTVTIKVVSLAGATVATVVNTARFTDGGAAVVFSASLSNISAFKLNIFLNNIPAGSHTIKFA